MDDTMNITAAQYTVDFEGNNSGIQATIDGKQMGVPLDERNRHYKQIMQQVADGTLTVEGAS